MALLMLIIEYVCSGLSLMLDIYFEQDFGKAVISALAFFCLYLVVYILRLKKCNKWVISGLFAISTIAGFAFCGESFVIPAIIIILDILLILLPRKYAFISVLVSTIIIFAVLKPSILVIIVSLAIGMITVVAVIICEKYEALRQQLHDKGEEISQLNEKISRLTKYSKSVGEAAAAEERSRFAVRIHDKLGHNISGSIILLEAAKLNIDINPEQAKSCISTATDNLRTGVDEIRSALKQERPSVADRGSLEINRILSEFSAKYEKKTELNISGDSEKIGFVHWSCINESLNESLTNMLKHSDGDMFKVNIAVRNKIIRCEFNDNGNFSGTFKKGMGLTAIEERTAAAGGKAVFNPSAVGFKTILIFEI